MKVIILTLILIGTLPSLHASSPHPVMIQPMRVKLQEASLVDSLEFLRRKGTEFLRAQIPPQFGPAVLTFEYRFDPTKHRKPVIYDRKNVQFGNALRDVCDQLGLVFEIQSIDRIAILDAPVEGP